VAGVLYWAANAPMATTAAPSKVATGTAIKTLLQIATPSTTRIAPVAWGISLDASAAGVPGTVELVQTDVAATVTAHVAAGVQPYNDPGAPASLVTLGTAATGYTATAEGTITATRTADLQQIAPTNQYTFVWPLAREFEVAVSRFLRVRVTFAATVNALCWVQWIEQA
jgi:hypothetical protein